MTSPNRDNHHDATHRSPVNHAAPNPSLSPVDPNAGRLAARKLSPGLLARMKLLDLHHKKHSVVTKEDAEVGRIPEDHLRELERLHAQDRSIRIQRRGRAWSGTRPPRLHPDQHLHNSLPGEGPDPHMLAPELSDRSSLVSERMDDDSEPDAFEEYVRQYSLPELENMAKGDTAFPDLMPNPDLPDLPLEEPESSQTDTAPESAPPTPPPKDTPPPMDDFDLNDRSDSIYKHLSRAPSVYTLSRVSFTNQIQQLTSIKLPDATSLQAQISAIPTSRGASRALFDASGQIRMWVAKAADVLNGLDAEDDVEWASAAGREGLDEVDTAINVFETLIKVFVVAIEELQTRPDIENISMQELSKLVDAMEHILNEWSDIKNKLKGVKEQVEIAMEWEELWNTVLGDIGLEMEALSRLVFEMEERRHRSFMAESATDHGVDIEALETIVEETPPNTKAFSTTRFSLTPALANPTPVQSPGQQQEDSNLLALFARMQPLRASLDFLPMRLSQFQVRAEPVFPSACSELENRCDTLENQWNRLERDAESLRRELGEDRWVLVFRNAGNQARKMCESVKRSLIKLHEALDTNEYFTDAHATAKKIESFEAKKIHYGPAIERVLTIIDKGVKDRLTVNGEILRLQHDIRREWASLEEQMKEMQERVDDLNVNQTSQLRDSISTILSNGQSIAGSVIDTPGTSPASSVVMSRKEQEREQRMAFKSRQSSFNSTRSGSAAKRLSSLPTPNSHSSTVPRKTQVSRSSASEEKSPSPRYSAATPTPSVRRQLPQPTSNKPRWNISTNMKDTVVGHNFTPLSLSTPSPHKDPTPPRSLRAVSSQANLKRSPLNLRDAPSPPPASSIPRPASTTPGHGALKNKRATMTPRTPSRNAYTRLDMRTASSSKLSFHRPTRRRSGEDDPDSDCHSPVLGRKTPLPRPGTDMATGSRRISMLPQPTVVPGGNSTGGAPPPRPSLDGGLSVASTNGGRDSRASSRAGGRLSSAGFRGSASRQGYRGDDGRPRWRF
ncbi:cortical protein KAR9-domain-containing protein [Phyllosticta citribraziliensis]|uniref:Cortical protein KAR9-domain-containing protein n=1 Tax=Phyllosticta citribraziliensis TaxID=989973 RepID=A0ABR1LC56_9PEZI